MLEWNRKSRNFYLETSVTMAGVVAAQSQKTAATCIGEWHVEEHKKGYPAILETLRTYPAYHPQAAVLAVLRKACGTF